MEIALRDYQQECLAALAEYRRKGGTRALVALPTGTGKTVIFAQIPRTAKKKVLVIAHREELLDQNAEKIRWANPSLQVEVEQADRHASPNAQVVVASIQTLAVSPHRLARLDPDDFSTVVIDEAHHTTAASYLGILAHFGLAADTRALLKASKGLRRQIRDLVTTNKGHLPADKIRKLAAPLQERLKDLQHEALRLDKQFRVGAAAPYLIGFTATPGRTDKKGLEAVYDEIPFQRTIRGMMEAGWLCPIAGERIATDVDIRGVHIRDGDYAEEELEELIDTEERNRLVVRSYLERAKERPALCFAVSVKHTFDLYTEFQHAGASVGMVVGTTPADSRHETIRDYKEGKTRVLVNCWVLTEGFDAPATSCLLMARPTRSQLVYTQMLGRGTRIHPEKDNLLVLDFSDVAKAGVASVNSLFGLDNTLIHIPNVLEMLKDIEELAKGAGRKPEWAEGESATIDPLRPNVSPLGKRLVWFIIPAGVVTLLPDESQLGIVENLLGEFELKYKSAGEASRVLASFGSARTAVAAGEAYALANYAEARTLLASKAAWRKEAPTERQLAAAARLGITLPPDATKGDASNAITQTLALRETRPATHRQEWVLRYRLGMANIPEGLTEGDAARLIRKSFTQAVPAP